MQIADRVLIHVDTNLPARNLITNRMAYVTYLLLSGMLGSSRQDETISPVKSSRLEYVATVNSILHAPIRQLDENWRHSTRTQLKLQAHIQ